MELINLSEMSENDLRDLSGLYAELNDANQNFDKMKINFEMIKENPLYKLLCVKIDNKIVGSVMGITCLDLVGECRPFMVLENVIVSNEYRRRNIGKILMSEIERIARSINCYYIIFVSRSDRKDAHLFYESMGYDLKIAQGFKKFMD